MTQSMMSIVLVLLLSVFLINDNQNCVDAVFIQPLDQEYAVDSDCISAVPGQYQEHYGVDGCSEWFGPGRLPDGRDYGSIYGDCAGDGTLTYYASNDCTGTPLYKTEPFGAICANRKNVHCCGQANTVCPPATSDLK